MSKRLTSAAMIVALSAFSVAAQQAPAPQAPPSGVDSRTNSGQNAHGSQSPGTTQSIGAAPNYAVRQGPDQFLGVSIVQQPVYMQDGRGIGEIDDLLIDRSGRIAAVVIDVGGFLGVTGRRVAVPMDALEFSKPTTPGSEPTSLKVVFKTDRAQLEKAPQFESAVGRSQRSR